MVEWNRTTTDYPHRSLQELFEEQVARTPDAIAVDFEEQCIGYAELNRRANQVAHWLRERGVVPDTMVGLCAERGIEMLVGMLAIVKAGGAYVPLDPGYPQSRLAFMLEDTATSLVLTESRFRHLFAAKTLCLDSEWQQVLALQHGQSAIGRRVRPFGVPDLHVGIYRPTQSRPDSAKGRGAAGRSDELCEPHGATR